MGKSFDRTHVVFRRNSNMYCVYCGDKADTREHCPSKAFLNKPYPTDLPTVPACKQCNNGFSADERYTSAYINYLYEYYENSNIDIFRRALKLEERMLMQDELSKNLFKLLVEMRN